MYQRRMVVKKKEFLFWIAYIVYLIFSIMQTTFFQEYLLGYYNFIYMFCAGLLLAQELLSGGWTKKTFIGIIVFTILVMLSIYINERQIMIMLMLVYAGRHVDFRKISRYTVVITSLLVLFTIMCAKFGIILNYVSTSTGEERNFLGFRYVLYGPAFLTNVILLEIYSKKDKIKYGELTLWFLIATWFYKNTHSRLAFYLSILMIAFALVMKLNVHLLDNRKVIRWIMSISFLWIGGAALLLIVFYNGQGIMKALNDVLTDRLLYGQRSLIAYGVSVLPQEINWVGFGLDYTGQHVAIEGEMIFVDCLYLKILQRFGILFFIILFSMLIATSVQANKNKNYYLLASFFFIAIHFAIDDLYLYIQYNTFWFVIGSILFGKAYEAIERFNKNTNVIESRE